MTREVFTDKMSFTTNGYACEAASVKPRLVIQPSRSGCNDRQVL